MLTLQAPSGAVQVTTLLPSPEWGDSRAHKAESRLRRSMSNVVYTYVRSPGNTHLKYELTLTQSKWLELVAFVQAFYGVGVLVTDHNGTVWDGFIATDPVSFQTTLVGDVRRVTLEFDAVEVTP